MPSNHLPNVHLEGRESVRDAAIYNYIQRIFLWLTPSLLDTTPIFCILYVIGSVVVWKALCMAFQCVCRVVGRHVRICWWFLGRPARARLSRQKRWHWEWRNALLEDVVIKGVLRAVRCPVTVFWSLFSLFAVFVFSTQELVCTVFSVCTLGSTFSSFSHWTLITPVIYRTTMHPLGGIR
jgi:hypothetical protein